VERAFAQPRRTRPIWTLRSVPKCRWRIAWSLLAPGFWLLTPLSFACLRVHSWSQFFGNEWREMLGLHFALGQRNPNLLNLVQKFDCFRPSQSRPAVSRQFIACDNL
jgi:hypothetical protein